MLKVEVGFNIVGGQGAKCLYARVGAWYIVMSDEQKQQGK